MSRRSAEITPQLPASLPLLTSDGELNVPWVLDYEEEYEEAEEDKFDLQEMFGELYETEGYHGRLFQTLIQEVKEFSRLEIELAKKRSENRGCLLSFFAWSNGLPLLYGFYLLAIGQSPFDVTRTVAASILVTNLIVWGMNGSVPKDQNLSAMRKKMKRELKEAQNRVTDRVKDIRRVLEQLEIPEIQELSRGRRIYTFIKNLQVFLTEIEHEESAVAAADELSLDDSDSDVDLVELEALTSSPPRTVAVGQLRR